MKTIWLGARTAPTVSQQRWRRKLRSDRPPFATKAIVGGHRGIFISAASPRKKLVSSNAARNVGSFALRNRKRREEILLSITTLSLRQCGLLEGAKQPCHDNQTDWHASAQRTIGILKLLSVVCCRNNGHRALLFQPYKCSEQGTLFRAWTVRCHEKKIEP